MLTAITRVHFKNCFKTTLFASIVWTQLLLVVSLIVAYPAFSAALPAGDVAPRGTPDQELNAGDLLLLEQFVNGTLTPSPEELIRADVVPDGALNAADVLMLQRTIHELTEAREIDSCDLSGVRALPSIALTSTSPATVNDGKIAFTASLDSTFSEDVRVRFTAINGTAIVNQDYEPLTAPLRTISANTLSKNIDVKILSSASVSGFKTFDMQLEVLTCNATPQSSTIAAMILEPGLRSYDSFGPVTGLLNNSPEIEINQNGTASAVWEGATNTFNVVSREAQGVVSHDLQAINPWQRITFDAGDSGIALAPAAKIIEMPFYIIRSSDLSQEQRIEILNRSIDGGDEWRGRFSVTSVAGVDRYKLRFERRQADVTTQGANLDVTDLLSAANINPTQAEQATLMLIDDGFVQTLTIKEIYDAGNTATYLTTQDTKFQSTGDANHQSDVTKVGIRSGASPTIGGSFVEAYRVLAWQDSVSSNLVLTGIEINPYNSHILTVTASQDLRANPFYGIEVRKNGVDITDDIVKITKPTPSKVQYEFGTQEMNISGDSITFDLDNSQIAQYGHYVSVREGSGVAGNTVPGMITMIDNYDLAHHDATDPLKPSLKAAVQGLARRYHPRDIETAPGVYNTQAIEDDINGAKDGKPEGYRFQILMQMRTFGSKQTHRGTGTETSFKIPSQWNKVRTREVHVYENLYQPDGNGGYLVDKKGNPLDKWVEVNKSRYIFSANKLDVVFNLAPSTPPSSWPNLNNIEVWYAYDPYPEYVHQDLGDNGAVWYDRGKNKGWTHALWRQAMVDWEKSFYTGVINQLKENLGQDFDVIEAVTQLETALGVSGSEYGYDVNAYVSGYAAVSIQIAKLLRKRATCGAMINQIPNDGNSNHEKGMNLIDDLAIDVALWGCRWEHPDIFNLADGEKEPNTDLNHANGNLEGQLYTKVLRNLHGTSTKMGWHQHNSNKELSYERFTGQKYFTQQQQFEKAQKAVTDFTTAGGYAGLGEHYVNWFISLGWEDEIFKTIVDNPTINPDYSNHNLWRIAEPDPADEVPIPNQTLTKVN